MPIIYFLYKYFLRFSALEVQVSYKLVVSYNKNVYEPLIPT